MKKSLQKLFLFICFSLPAVSVFAQNIIDFETGISTIPNVGYDEQLIVNPFTLASSGKIFKISLTNSDDPTPPVYSNKIFYTRDYGNEGSAGFVSYSDDNTRKLVIETADGSEFKFERIYYDDYVDNSSFTLEGYKDNVLVVTETINSAGTGFLTPVDPLFSNIDKIIISAELGFNTVMDDFTWSNSTPTVNTNTPAAIATTSATLGGTISSQGLAPITEKGIVWGTAYNPTTADNIIEMGSGTAPFSQTVTDLPAGTSIYARAYAINSYGTGYGDNVSFTTLVPPNTVPTATNLTQNKSFTEDGGNVALDDIVVTDPDASETITATLTLSSAAAGVLTTGTYGSATSTF